MIRHSPLSPFHMSAASAISNLKFMSSTATATSVDMSAAKRRKLSIVAASATASPSFAPDSDLKAAASALAVLASGFVGVGGNTRQSGRSPLKPKNINATVSALDMAKTGEENRGSFHLGKPPVKPPLPTAGAKSSLQRQPLARAPQTLASSSVPHALPHSRQLHTHHQSHHHSTSSHSQHSIRYPPSSYQHSLHQAPPVNNHNHNNNNNNKHHHHHHHHHPSTYPRMMPNPLGWMWPMVPSQPHRAWPNYSSRSALSQPLVGGTSASSKHQYLEAQNKQHLAAINAFGQQPAEERTEKDWTAEDEKRLAKLVDNYKKSSRGMKRKHSSKTSNSASSEIEEEVEVEEQEEAVTEPMDDEDQEQSTIVTAEVTSATNSNNNNKAGRRKRTIWSEEEDNELIGIVAELKKKTDKICWSTVMRLMPGRDSKQCRDRWLNHLDTVAQNNKSTWTEEEDRKLVHFIKKHGTRWRLMQATILPHRTELTIKNRWNSAMKRRYTRFLSKRWGVEESNIQLLTSRGLLNAGVNVEQMLRVARCKMSEVAYRVGEAESSREMIMGTFDRSNIKRSAELAWEAIAKHPKSNKHSNTSDASSSNNNNLSEHDDIADVLKKYENKFSDDSSVRVRILKGQMADDSAVEDLGVMVMPGSSSFAVMRDYLNGKFQSLASSDFRFSLNQLGIITSRQEVDLGPMGAIFQAVGTGHGTEKEPFDLLVVD